MDEIHATRLTKPLLLNTLFSKQQTNKNGEVQEKEPKSIEVSSAISTFNKSIKLDVNQYQNFKEERFWDTWHRSFLAQLQLHDLQNVIKGEMVPPSQQTLFKRQNAFVYSVFLTSRANCCRQNHRSRTLLTIRTATSSTPSS